MTKKSIKAIKKFEKLSPAEQVLAGAIGVAIFPLALTWGVYKDWDKRQGSLRKRRKK